MDVTIRNAAIAAVAIAVAAGTAHGGCVGDVNGDGTTGFDDLVELLASWGPCPGCPADIDGSGDVGFGDLVTLLSDWGSVCGTPRIDAEALAGENLGAYPWFTSRRTFLEGDIVTIAIDPAVHPALIGVEVDAVIVASKTAAEWDADLSLTDVRGAAQAVTFAGPDLPGSRVELTGILGGDGGATFGVGYDLVVDVDRNGVLSTGDLIDGYGDESGFYVVNDTTALGPYETTTIFYSGGAFLGQLAFFPDNIATMGQLPLVIIAHGNGHAFNWYAYLANHLASHGFLVMSHQNNTVPGIETASTSTLLNTDYLLANQATINGGILNGHIDSSRITWIGHSRGGEGVVRAYDRIRDGNFVPVHYDIDDIVLISSIAPTDFLGTNSANPAGVWYHLMFGSADGDVHGGASCNICQSFHLLERATESRASTYVHGADHNDFNCCGFNDYCANGGSCSSALAIGREEAQQVAKSTYLALINHVVRGSLPARDFLYRQYEDLRPLGVADTTIVDLEFKDGPDLGNVVIDDYQTQAQTSLSSSGGAVTFDVSNLVEARLDDANSNFAWTTSDPMNGMTRALTSDTTRGCVFDWNGDRFLEFEIVPSERDLSDDTSVSFRFCQGTRHPNTTAETGDTTFTVTLRDGAGVTSSIQLGVYGGGAEEPFRRNDSGAGIGWANEFETIRIQLADFLSDGGLLDLTDVVALRFEFGPSFGSTTGRIGLDDVEITRN